MQETLHHIPDDILDAPPKSRSSLPTFSLSNPLPDPIPSLINNSQAHSTASSSHATAANAHGQTTGMTAGPANGNAAANSYAAANGPSQHDIRQAGQRGAAESSSKAPSAGAADDASHDLLPSQALDQGRHTSAADQAAGKAGAEPLAHVESQPADDQAGPQQTSFPDGMVNESSDQAVHSVRSLAGLDPKHPHPDVNGSTAEPVQQVHALTGSRPAPDDAASVLQPPLQDTVEPVQDGLPRTRQHALLQHAKALGDQGRGGSAATGHELQHSGAFKDQSREGSAATGHELQHCGALGDQGSGDSAATGHELPPQNWQAGAAGPGSQDAGALQGGREEQQVHKKARASSVPEAVAA